MHVQPHKFLCNALLIPMPSHSGGWPCQLAHPAWAPPKKVAASQATSVKDGPMPQLVGCNPPPLQRTTQVGGLPQQLAPRLARAFLVNILWSLFFFIYKKRPRQVQIQVHQ